MPLEHPGLHLPLLQPSHEDHPVYNTLNHCIGLYLGSSCPTKASPEQTAPEPQGPCKPLLQLTWQPAHLGSSLGHSSFHPLQVQSSCQHAPCTEILWAAQAAHKKALVLSCQSMLRMENDSTVGCAHCCFICLLKAPSAQQGLRLPQFMLISALTIHQDGSSMECQGKTSTQQP